jgi:hypothetical protein
VSDPFLNYFALGLLIFVVVVIFYGMGMEGVPFLWSSGNPVCS